MIAMNTNPQIDLDRDALQDFADQIIASAVERLLVVQESQGGLRMARTWPYQKKRDIEKHGKDKAPWYCGFRDLDGRKQGKWCGTGEAGYRLCLRECQRIQAELVTGTYRMGLSVDWKQFRQEYEERIVSGKARATRIQYAAALDRFEELVAPKKVSKITTGVIDQFIARRQAQPNVYHPDRPIAARSVNCDLLCLKAVLGVAHEWGYLAERPKFRFLRVPKRLPRYMPPEDFLKVYRAADQARLPRLAHCSAGDWWKCLLVFVYVATGWRIGQCLGLLREDLDLGQGTVIARGIVEGNKGKRDQIVKLHPVAVEHLGKMRHFGAHVFEWPHHRRTLDTVYRDLQEQAQTSLVYGFHDLRRSFGTMNAGRLTPTELQHLMQHAKLQTTQEYYINPEATQEEAVARLYVPPGLTG